MMMMRGGGGGGGQSDSSNNQRASSSCAACKMLKRRCRETCIFAPYFRSDESKKFAKVHKVFGASNVSKILVEVPEEHREDTVNSLAYEAEARLLDPVYGCIGAIAILQRRLSDLHRDLAIARARLARYTTTTTATTTSTYGGGCVFNNNNNNNHGGVFHGYYNNDCDGTSTSLSSSSSSSFGGGQTGSLEFGHHHGYSNGNGMYDYGFVPYIL